MQKDSRTRKILVGNGLATKGKKAEQVRGVMIGRLFSIKKEPYRENYIYLCRYIPGHFTVSALF